MLRFKEVLQVELSKNSIWELKDFDALDDGLYRALDFMQDVESVILFPLNNPTRTVRPVAVSIALFIEQIKDKTAIKTSFKMPNYLLLAEEDIPEQYIKRRDKNYNLVKDIVVDRTFVFDFATKKRVPQLAEYAAKVGVDRKTLARLLTLYWRYGQDKMALIPAFLQSGALGKERNPTIMPLGAPKKIRTLAIKRGVKFIVSDLEKNTFKKAIKKYYLRESGLSLAKTYKKMLADSYSEEIRFADACSQPPLVPTIKQFRYWSKKLFSKEEVIKRRTTENNHLRNQRGLLSSVTQDSFLPGTHYEIDATVADVHIVSALGSQHVLGRPTIYIVADRASRMIVGMHVSLYHASWRAARQALVNCFLPKANYCKEFGIDIDDSEWPCAHIPKELVCDNGEMIGVQPKKALTPMTKLSFTPPYRPDCKGVVEKRFDILNDEVLHELLGSTKGGNVVRGSKDPRKDAIYTLREVTIEIIKAVREHNRTLFNDLAFSSPLIVANDLSPTPLNYWKIHIAKHRHELQSAIPDDVIARLLPPAEVSVTRSGIHFNGLYYSCAEVEERELCSIARTAGQWRLEARIDENTTNHIYVRLDKNKGFVRCNLLPRSRMFSDKAMCEPDFIKDWIEAKKELAPISVASIDDHHHRQQVTRNAKQRSNLAKKKTFAEKTRDVRMHRKNELEATVNMTSSEDEVQEPNAISAPHRVKAKVISLPKGRKRKTKGGDS